MFTGARHEFYDNFPFDEALYLWREELISLDVDLKSMRYQNNFFDDWNLLLESY